MKTFLIGILFYVVAPQTHALNIHKYSFKFSENKSIEILVAQKGEQKYIQSVKTSHSGLKISQMDKQLLFTHLQAPNFNQDDTHALLGFLYSQVPADTVIDDFTYVLNEENSWTLICNKIGQIHEGQFTALGFTKILTAPIGMKDTECYGRCGAGCGTWPDDMFKYTQECFEHDLCNRDQGTQLGECSDEFWIAASGYLFAPRCE